MAVCIFCGHNGPLSREHVIPQWMHPLLPKYTQSFTRDVRTIAGSKGLGQAATGYSRIGRPLTAAQPRIACRSCNSGWMSELQTRVQTVVAAMILGQEVLPSHEFWRELIAWLAMTTMTGEFIDRRFLVIPQSDRTALYSHCAEGTALHLPGWEFGIANFRGMELNNPMYRHYRQRLSYSCVSQASTFRFGELVLTAHSGVNQLAGLEEVLEQSEYRKLVQPLRGQSQTPEWPPPVSITDATAQSVTRRVLLALHRGFSEGRPEFIVAGKESYRWIVEHVDVTSIEPAVPRANSAGRRRKS